MIIIQNLHLSGLIRKANRLLYHRIDKIDFIYFMTLPLTTKDHISCIHLSYPFGWIGMYSFGLYGSRVPIYLPLLVKYKIFTMFVQSVDKITHYNV